MVINLRESQIKVTRSFINLKTFLVSMKLLDWFEHGLYNKVDCRQTVNTMMKTDKTSVRLFNIHVNMKAYFTYVC